MKNSDRIFDSRNRNNTRFLSSMKVFKDKSSLSNSKKFNPDTYFEKQLTKKYRENSSKIKKDSRIN